MEKVKAVPRGTRSLTYIRCRGQGQGLRSGVLVTSILLHSTIQKHPGPGAEVVAVSTERNKTKLPPSGCAGVNPVNCVKT